MTGFDPTSLLDVPPFPADRVAGLADRLATLIGTRNDVVFVQAEAVVALEAVAISLGRPALTAVNVVTSPYGAWFGAWLRRGGARVIDVTASPARPITVDAVAAALAAHPEASLLSIVHAESASGIRNPIEAILPLARAAGLLTVVDAVASVGGHTFAADDLGADIVVVGPQKALAGPAGISAVAVSERAWAAMDHQAALTPSVLSLTDQKRLWLDAGRGALPGTPAPLELWALAAALDRIDAEGVDAVIARHAGAAAATRAGLAALGWSVWVDAAEASHLVTTVELPDGIDADAILSHLRRRDPDVSLGVGPGADRLLRLNHTGLRARSDVTATLLTAMSAGPAEWRRRS